MPVLSFLYSIPFPSAKDAMGFTGYYQEDLSLYTFPSDHSYALKFPGDEKKFHSFARRMGLSDHRVSDTEYLEEGDDWSRRVKYSPNDPLTNIEYTSNSH